MLSKAWYSKEVAHKAGQKRLIKMSENVTKYLIETRNEAGELHSFFDEPAVRIGNDYMAWYKNGLLHRDDLPAIIASSVFSGDVLDALRELN